MAAPKILVLGSLNGQLEPALKKVAALHAKNSFSLAILTGQVFSSPPSSSSSDDDKTISALLDGSIEIPLPTYFTVGTGPLPPRIAAKIAAGENELCPNLHYLGKRSITKTSDGLRIVALGGALDANLVAGLSKEQHLPFHSADDAKSLRGANSADILLTAAWPAGIWNGSSVLLEGGDKDGVSLRAEEDVAELCAALRPRYHISASPDAFFYEREPFVHPPTTASTSSVTRFISVAPYGNQAKAKAMYAFTLNKSDDDAPPPGTTPSPFATRQPHHKRPHTQTSEPSSFSRYSTSHQHPHDRRSNKRRRGGGGNAPLPGPDRCYFCLSNPNISAHMCCSIGDDAYLTTAKGPLLTSSTFADKGLPFPGHFIIIPLPHAPTIASMPGSSTADPASDAAKTLSEMHRFRTCLQAMLAARSGGQLGAVTWEISRARNVHLIWQLIAVPAALIRGGVVEAAFRVEAENLKYPPLNVADEHQDDLPSTSDQGDYFRLWLWTAKGKGEEGEEQKEDKKEKGVGSCKTLVMPLGPEARFDLQFGRRVLAKLLGLDDRFRWRACEQTSEEESKDVAAFREAFEEWDFTLA